MNGATAREGRVEVYYEYAWGTICSYDWDIGDAYVICRMLGYPSAIRASTYAEFGEGTGDIILAHVHCTGSEQHIGDCPHDGYRMNYCGHYADAGVVCAGDGKQMIILFSFVITPQIKDVT